MPAISIIVPIYNAQQFLNDCIDSILAQTFKDFELILVNDGSTDKSPKICDEYAKQDHRIMVIHKSNGGISSTRNKGIEAAKGKYIGFVDADDTIEPNMYEILLETALSNRADIAVCSYKSINLIKNSQTISKVWKNINNRKTFFDELLPLILVNKTYSLPSCWNKLYKKSILDLYNVRFEHNQNYGEDARFNYTLLTLIENLVFVEQPLYNYYIREGRSLSKVYQEELYRYEMDNRRFLIQLCKKHDLERYLDIVKNYYAGVSILHMQEMAMSDIPLDKKYQIISRIFHNEEFREDILKYDCPTYFSKLLKYLCKTKNEKLFFCLSMIRKKIQLLIDRVS